MVRLQRVKQFGARLREDAGVALIWAAMTVPILLIISAMVTDFGLARIEKNRLQNTVDAAALAGTPELPSATDAKDKAAEWAFNNFQIATYAQTACGAGYNPGATRCYLGEGQLIAVTTPYNGDVIGSHSASDLVNVEACKSVDTTFSSLIGVNSLTVCTDATAVKQVAAPASAGSCGLCLIGEGNITGLEATGKAAIAVVDGSIHANSSSGSA